jgi:hypothetical protein
MPGRNVTTGGPIGKSLVSRAPETMVIEPSVRRRWA